MVLYTVRNCHWRAVRKAGIMMLDITVMTGVKYFAPTYDLLERYKSGQCSTTEYTKEFFALMRESYRKNRSHWDALLNEPVVALGCYCGQGDFCHRYLMVYILHAIATQRNIQFEYKGELYYDGEFKDPITREYLKDIYAN